MIHPSNSYVKLLVWELPLEKENHLSQRYGHVALETCTGSPDFLTTYMSFWTSCHNDRCGLSSHFHESKEQDDQEENKRVAISYLIPSLNIEKINAAFAQFKVNPNAWGVLGWGIFGNAYARDPCGLTVFLLERGGSIGNSNGIGVLPPGGKAPIPFEFLRFRWF